MTNTPPNKQPDLQDIDDGDSTNATQHVRKRDKVREFLRIPKSKTKDLRNKASDQSLDAGGIPQATSLPFLTSQALGPIIVSSQAKIYSAVDSGSNDAFSDDNISTSSNVPTEKPLPRRPPSTQVNLLDVFTENLAKPTLKTDLPTLLDRIEKTEQLVYCSTLLVQASSLKITANAGEGATNTTTNTIALKVTPTLTDKDLKWLAEMDKNPMEKAHIRWLAVRMVEEFIQDPDKDSFKIAEIVALGPILGREPYRKLLSSIIGGFEDARILDTNLLQGLVQLVQSASPGFLASDDLVKIFSLLRTCLHGTHQQSTEHSLHLALAVS
ncbi:hypothetical protein BGZ95_004137, partial [Linnemannia exigua]